ncbi:nucleotide-diphospho-sugar transferase [Radiomyces spectabilis]|uniref:nucleotide-diphospho-sugar transferase n=1 Tax=Radiomyces spectabilis TaxID=64574 RepID=UPI00222060C2|nr:nucleotide-diphospho-sugar transferase [Radiomyces spectabilis]KAI8371698.1 nucleotide-diphospho-sugar transferase [Radiomyces spectabilis]
MEIDQVKYPWDSSAARRKGYNKACRYSKLNLWNLTDYRKVVFLDADTMVVQSIDDLFERPQFSAAIDVGGAINTGVFVAEPSKETYDEIMKVYAKAPSYNRGDQGFLNWYFASSVHPLPGNYNLMIKFAHFSALVRGYLDKNTAKILHYTSETKPWNFFYLHHREWKENYEGYLFGAWKRNFRHMRASLQEGRLWSDDLDADWDNANRVTDICDVQLKKDFGRRYRYADRFSVLIYLTSPSIRINDFANLLRTYSRSKKVHRIYIIADLKDKDRLLVDPLWIESLNIKTPVETIASGYNSPNNRFIPPASLQTEAVLIADDNVLPDSVRSIDFLFETWADQKDAIVGHFISSHQGTAKSKIQYIASDGSQPSQYSMIRTQSMFLKTDYLYAYTCLLPEQIHQYLDKHPDCTEIAINMMASGTSATRPLFVNAPVTRLPTQRATGPDASEMSQCIVDLMPMFGGKNTLLYNNQVISLLDDH